MGKLRKLKNLINIGGMMPHKQSYLSKVDGTWQCELRDKKGKVHGVGYGDTKQEAINDAISNVDDRGGMERFEEDHPILMWGGIILVFFVWSKLTDAK